VDLCSEQLSFGADGNAGPLFCANGALNTVAWDYFAKNNPQVLPLGPNATPAQVQQAVCSDVRNSTNPIETSTYKLAVAYYGWSFGVDPTEALTNGGCP
jgi:hypothetical protein